MAQATMTCVLSAIVNEIPREMLELSFKPRQYQTTIEQRIISEIIEGPILLDTNLVGGVRRDIILSPSWELNLKEAAGYIATGSGIQGSYYKVPPEAREGRNISSVVGVTQAMDMGVPGSSVSIGNAGYTGNTAQGLTSAMLNTYTFGSYPIPPQVTLEGTNIIRFHPRQLVDGSAVTIMLENDSEFLNVNISAIAALSDLCVCATQRYIANKLIVSSGETEVVAGLELSIVSDLIREYKEKGERYKELLIKYKGAAHYNTRTLSRMIYYAL